MTRPNILIVYTDQWRGDSLGIVGNAEVKTPNLDALAQEGVCFSRCFVQNPVCMPSRVSFLSGQYPSQLHITHMGVPVPEDLLTLPRILGRSGYTTANIGKLHFLPHAGRDHREVHPDYGFDHLEISDEPGCYEDAYRAWVRRKAPEALDLVSFGLPPATEQWQRSLGMSDGIQHPPRATSVPSVFPAHDDLTHTAFVAEQTMEYLRRPHEEPFLCIAGFYSPHEPWIVPERFRAMYDPEALSLARFPAQIDARRGERFSDEALRAAKHGYYAAISEVDYYVGQLLQCLADEGLAQDTIVVFTSDHGEYLGEFLRFGKWFPGEDCISRVPLLVRWPGGPVQPGMMVEGIVEAVDVVPTLLQWAGIPIPPVVQGVPLLDGAASGASAKQSALLETSEGKSLRTDGFRYVARTDGSEALYDLNQDLGEYHDVAAQPGYAGVLAEMRGELVRRMLQMERPLPRCFPY